LRGTSGVPSYAKGAQKLPKVQPITRYKNQLLHFCSLFVLSLFHLLTTLGLIMSNSSFIKDFAALSLLFFSGYVLTLIA